MDEEARKPSRIRFLLGVTSVVVSGWIFLNGFSEAGATQQSRFMGGNPSVLESDELNMLRLRFPAGSRSNWHSHTDGQLLMLEEGLGRTQVRGEALQEMHPGEPWWTEAGVEHWHGAAPEEASVQLTIYSGGVEWLEPVGDEVYRAPPGR